MSTYWLLSKTTHQPIYGGQSFETEEPTPAGLLGGPGQSLWYWLDVTTWTAQQLSDRKAQTRTPPGGETISASEENVVVTAEGTWGP